VDFAALVKALADFASPQRRAVVCTLGTRPTIACETGADRVARPVLPIAPDEIVDTNGAGDAFAGGFLAFFVKGATLEKCIDAGSYAAHACLRVRGCSVPAAAPMFA
jgi:adenosine kinase